MALRIFYPPSFSTRHHPYLDIVDEFLALPSSTSSLPIRRKQRNCVCRRQYRRPDSILGDDWMKSIEDIFDFNRSSDDEMKTVEQKSETDFNLKLDLTGFDSDQIKVKAIGRKLIVDAENEEETEEHGFKTYSRKQFHKSIILPDDVKLDDVKLSLTNAGMLRISAPVRSLPAPKELEKEIAVEKEETQDDDVEKKTTNN